MERHLKSLHHAIRCKKMLTDIQRCLIDVKRCSYTLIKHRQGCNADTGFPNLHPSNPNTLVSFTSMWYNRWKAGDRKGRPYTRMRYLAMELPKRKQIRLPDYDYSASGAYFVTVCTQGRCCILSDIAVGALHEAPAISVRLTQIGQIVDEVIRSLPARYSDLEADQYVVMPNHIHLLLRIEAGRAIRESPLRADGTRPLLAKAVGI